MNDPTEVKLHFLDYWRVVRSRIGLVFLTFSLTIVTALVVTYFLPRQYYSQVKLEVKPDDYGVKAFGNQDVRGTRDLNFTPTQFQILRSKEILYRVIETLGLADSWSQGGRRLTNEQAYDKLLHMLEMREERNTDLIVVGVYSINPKEAADIANSIAVSYAERRRSDQESLLSGGLSQVQEEVNKQRRVVEEASAESQRIRLEKNIVDMNPETLETAETIETRNVVANQQKADEARLEAAKLKAQLDGIDNLKAEAVMVGYHTLGVEDPTIAKTLPVFQEAKVEEARLLNTGLGSNHPRIKALRATQEVQGRQLNEAVAALRSSLQTRLKIQEATFMEAQRQLDLSKEDYQTRRTQGDEYIKAKNKYVQAKKVLEMAEQNLSTQAIQKGVSIHPVIVWEKAEAATLPAKPNVPAYMVLATLAGIIAGIGLAFFVEYLDTSVKTVEDVEKFLGVSVLAVIPKGVGVLMNEVAEHSPAAEAYRILRTNIEFQRKNPQANSITVISGGPGEGKSTTLNNLAYTCAKGGYSVLLVDADLRRPSQHRLFGVDHSTGLTNYLTSNMPWEEVVRSTQVENLSFIPSGLLPADSVGVLNSQRMSDLITKAKRQYDLVLLDSPPILGVSDGSVLASEVDLVIMVVEHRRFPRSMLQRVKLAVTNVGGTLLGVVLNKVDAKSDQGYQYYTNYDYYAPQSPEEKKRPAVAKRPIEMPRAVRSSEQY